MRSTVGAGTFALFARTQEMLIRVYRSDPSTGRKELLKEVMPADPAGIFWPNLYWLGFWPIRYAPRSAEQWRQILAVKTWLTLDLF